MKKIIVSIICVSFMHSHLLANQGVVQKPKEKQYGFEYFYLASLPDGAQKTIDRTLLYKEAMDMYYKKKYHKPEEMIVRENGKKVKKHVSFPDFKAVENKFIQSYLEEKNRAALFIAAYIHKNYGDTYTIKGQTEYFHLVSSLAREGNCFGYLESSKYFSEGIADITASAKEAQNILKLAEKRCAHSIYAGNIKKELLMHKSGFYKDKLKAKEARQ